MKQALLLLTVLVPTGCAAVLALQVTKAGRAPACVIFKAVQPPHSGPWGGRRAMAHHATGASKFRRWPPDAAWGGAPVRTRKMLPTMCCDDAG
jgi:hypothetical protein